MANYDAYGRAVTIDPGTTVPNQGPSAGLSSVVPFWIKVPLTAATGTTDSTLVTVPQKARLIDAIMITTSTVTSATVQVFSATGGGGTAATSSMAAAAAGTTRNALAAASSTFAAGAIAYVYRAGGATLCGGECYLQFLPEA